AGAVEPGDDGDDGDNGVAADVPEAAEEVAAPAVLAGGGVTAWVVSGRSEEGLAAQAGRLREWVAERPG
uniref:hypothetical protein n=1 Tax=Streptomyces sp. CA2R106 TaxID=3120153 RepID=UPI00300903FE